MSSEVGDINSLSFWGLFFVNFQATIELLFNPFNASYSSFFINDIATDIGSNIRLFADDTSLFMIVEFPNTAAELLKLDPFENIMTWAKPWPVSFNPK